MTSKGGIPADLHPELTKLGNNVLKLLNDKHILTILNTCLKDSSVKKLDLHGKALRGSDLQTFLHLLKFLDKLEELDLSGNDFPPEAAKALGTNIVYLKNLKSLNLIGTQFF